MTYLSVTLTLLIIAMVLADLRWLRVAQREHYLPGTVSRFAARWWSSPWYNAILALAALATLAMAPIIGLAAVVPGLVVMMGPIGLGLRGRTSPLAWTLRLKTLAALVAALQGLLVLVGAVFGLAVLGATLAAVLAPVVVDAALVLARPIEERRAAAFVAQARKKLRSISPTVVGITGSYGKTSTKNFLGQLLEGRRSAVLTPASFNNRAGLSRSINEHLTPGSDVFVAEMGTYGFGEIAELCHLCPPQISVFTAVGPVHLERFGSEDNVVKAKSEIFETADVAIVNVDDQRLAAVADHQEQAGKTVWRCSALDTAADVCLLVEGEGVTLFVKGVNVGTALVPDVPLTNVACAVAAALQLDVPAEYLLTRLPNLRTPAHRQEVSVTEDGVLVVDDTYNANPAGVRRALAVLADVGAGASRRVVVTPGMVELGPRQAEENRKFAAEAGRVATDVVIVGRTNRRALRQGLSASKANVVIVPNLGQAVAWVRKQVGSGDAVLYANDLPDHFA